MQLQKNQRLVMIGDSITDCERWRPIGDGPRDATGKGYVALMDALLSAVHPELNVRIINMGNSGDTVRDLAARWETDVVDLKPDWLSVMVGINDVCRQFNAPRRKETHVYLEEYEATYRRLLQQTRASLKGLILATPYYIETNRADPIRAQMDEYGAVVKRLAGEFDAVFVDTQAALDEVMKVCYPGALAPDRVHPLMTGHMILALAFLKALEFSL